MPNKSNKLLITSIISIFSLFTISLTSSLFISVPDHDLSFNMNAKPDDPIKTIYFISQSWWNVDAANTYVYEFNSSSGTNNGNWPGNPTTQVMDFNDGRKLWKFNLDTDKFDYFIFSRRTEDNQDGNAQTSDLAYEVGINCYNLGSECWYNGSYSASTTKGTWTWNNEENNDGYFTQIN